MAYIEREELLNNLKRFAPEHLTPLIVNLVQKQPAADVVEVRHGEWKVIHKDKIATVYECSECGRLTFGRSNGRSNYCICGAKMDGKDGK